MKIRSIHTYKAGPLGTQTLDFHDDWSGKTHERILLSGPNGCGKSTVLKIVAMLWSAFGYWLHHRKPLPKRHPDRQWLERWGAVSVVLDDSEYFSSKRVGIILFFGGFSDANDYSREFFEKKFFFGQMSSSRGSDILYFNNIVNMSTGDGSESDVSLNEEYAEDGDQANSPEAIDGWSKKYQRILVDASCSGLENMVFLDAEERRWVSPRRGVGEILPDNLKNRWLSRYSASDAWEGQLEASLLSLKVAEQERFLTLIQDMNAFLSGKAILPEVKLGENRIRVQLQDGGTHGLDELSAGEHQVLILLYQISRWMEKGGVVLIDEPDLYLHPSLIAPMLTRLERMVQERGGQLIISSHVPEVWARYEAIGHRVLLGQPATPALASTANPEPNA